VLPLLEEVDVVIRSNDEVAALEHLRHLPHLRRLELTCCERAVEAACPRFIPPSLKSLKLSTTSSALLEPLPAVLQASGAVLEETDLVVFDEVGAALAQLLRSCPPTLKILELGDLHGGLSPECVHNLVAALVSRCATLEVLCCPWDVFSALPATCPAFPRLTKLHLGQSTDYEATDLASPAWDIVANGRLPALASLTLSAAPDFKLGERVEEAGASEGGGGLARALEAVAGTLRQLSLAGG
jgi:hypothetical protein